MSIFAPGTFAAGEQFERSTLESQQQMLDEQVEAIEALRLQVAEFQDLINRIFVAEDEYRRSAGGATDDPAVNVMAALPKTGDIMLTNQTVIPPGWLECDGTIVPQHAYPELYEILHDSYSKETLEPHHPLDPNLPPGTFALPAPYQLPGIGATAYDLMQIRNQRYIIRT